jgi:hypothetical protein
VIGYHVREERVKFFLIYQRMAHPYLAKPRRLC